MAIREFQRRLTKSTLAHLYQDLFGAYCYLSANTSGNTVAQDACEVPLGDLREDT